MLRVDIEQRRDSSGGTYLAAATDPIVPPDLASVVSAVTGLDPDFPVSAAKSKPVKVPARGLKPMDLALAYDFKSLWEAGITGAGQNVAIIQFGVDTDQDLGVYDDTFGIQAPDVERIPIDGGLAKAPADFATEAALDTEVLRAVAPGAQIRWSTASRRTSRSARPSTRSWPTGEPRSSASPTAAASRTAT